MNEPTLHSTIPPEVAAAYLEGQRTLENPTKNRIATISHSYTYAYADLDGTMEAYKTAFHPAGFAVSQPVRTDEEGRLVIDTLLIHESGVVLSLGSMALHVGDDPQRAGTAVTYLRRYSLTSAVGMVAEEDDDANASRNAERSGQTPETRSASDTRDMSEKQSRYIWAMSKELDYDEDALRRVMEEVTGKSATRDMTARDASMVIDELTAHKSRDEARE